MPVITLTTDLGLKDHYVASIKGAIHTLCPDATVVDISHEVQPFDILQASFLIKNCYREFPPGTIHVLGINPDLTDDSPHVLVEIDQHFFVGADNGIFSLIFDKKPDNVYELNITPEQGAYTFPTKSIFVTAACHIAKGGSPEIIGKAIEGINQRGVFSAVPEPSIIKGMATYIDHYGNVISNIPEQLFNAYKSFEQFRVVLRREDYDITNISRSYHDVPEGERLALFSATGFLEIAINRGNASKLLGIKQNDIIRIEFS